MPRSAVGEHGWLALAVLARLGDRGGRAIDIWDQTLMIERERGHTTTMYALRRLMRLNFIRTRGDVWTGNRDGPTYVITPAGREAIRVQIGKWRRMIAMAQEGLTVPTKWEAERVTGPCNTR